MREVFTKYKLMRAKMKISFQAFIKNETVFEHWLKTIERSVKYLVKSGQIPKGKFSLKRLLFNKLDSKKLLTLRAITNIQVEVEKSPASRFKD